MIINVFIAGNGLVVCGDTWQEAKLMFETLLQLFDVTLELRKAGIGAEAVTRKTLPPKKVTRDADSEIAVVHESKPPPKKPTLKPYVAKKPAVPIKIIPIHPYSGEDGQRFLCRSDMHSICLFTHSCCSLRTLLQS